MQQASIILIATTALMVILSCAIYLHWRSEGYEVKLLAPSEWRLSGEIFVDTYRRHTFRPCNAHGRFYGVVIVYDVDPCKLYSGT